MVVQRRILLRFPIGERAKGGGDRLERLFKVLFQWMTESKVSSTEIIISTCFSCLEDYCSSSLRKKSKKNIIRGKYLLPEKIIKEQHTRKSLSSNAPMGRVQCIRGNCIAWERSNYVLLFLVSSLLCIYVVL